MNSGLGSTRPPKPTGNVRYFSEAVTGVSGPIAGFDPNAIELQYAFNPNSQSRVMCWEEGRSRRLGGRRRFSLAKGREQGQKKRP